MTIAVGVVCSDGLILGADSQETHATLKLPCRKIQHIKAPGLHLVIAGSGDAAFIDYSVQEIGRAVLQAERRFTQSGMCLQRFMNRTFAPLVQMLKSNC